VAVEECSGLTATSVTANEMDMSSVIARLTVPAVLTVLLAAAVYTDLRHGKIYNKLTLTCIALGIILSLLSAGLRGLGESLAGIGLIMLLYLLFAPLTGIGGGDVKLIMAVGALMGIRFTVWSLLFSAAIGGLLAVIVMIRHRVLADTLKGMSTSLILRVFYQAPVGITGGSRGLKFRYSPAIALGTLLAYFLRR
jgi:prepilin peptidase CpaA